MILRRSSRHIGRGVFAWLSRRYTQSTRRQLADKLNLRHPGSTSTIIHRIDQLRKTEAPLQHDLDEIAAQLKPCETTAT